MVLNYATMTHRVTLFGTSFGGVEEWTTGFWMGAEGFGSSAPTQAQADAIKTLWQTYFTNTASKFGNNWKTTGVKVALIREDGTSHPEDSVFSYYTTPITGTSTDTVPLPPQCSLVATLTSTRARGYGSKGRMFLPGINVPITSTGKIPGTAVTSLIGPLKTFLDGVNAHIDIPDHIILNSSGPTGVHSPGIFTVTGVKIGDVYDTQRRRRNQLTETYTAVALV